MDSKELIQFEKDIIEMYLAGKLPYPIHLSGGNEKEIIEIFKNIKKEDWIVTTYRSHYHSLLKSGKKDWLVKKIKKGRSIHVHSKKYKIVSTAIVGGHISTAVGIAMGIKMNNGTNLVWCFIGDMTATTGQFEEAYNYSMFNKLPIRFVIEDNTKSTDTPTASAWVNDYTDDILFETGNPKETNIYYYKYKRTLPHYGCGKFVDFKK